MIQITEKEACCGCSACSQCCPVGAISMYPDEQGFLYPVVDNNICIQCGKCNIVCPIQNPCSETHVNQKAYLLQHNDLRVLLESSSGGAFSAIAAQIIESGGVVFGAAYDTNFRVRHTYVEKKEDLEIFRNSKYTQSDVEDSYKKVRAFLQSGRSVCFSGTPCQVEGLLNYLGDKSCENLVLVDIVCHAVPSPFVWQSYLEIIKKRGIQNIRNLRFRDKEKYGYLYSQFKIETEKKNYYQGIETNEMLRAFFSEICNRPSCYSCQFKKRYRRSDITIWDCFDINKFTKSKTFRQDMGISRVITHSWKGETMIENCRETCKLEEITPENALHFDAKEMIESVKKNPKYEAFWQSFYMDKEGTIIRFFPRTTKNDLESFVRKISMKLGFYQLVRKTYKRFLGNRQR